MLQHILVGGADLLGRNSRHLGNDRLDFFDIDQALALARRQQALTRTGLIDHVDRLVRQQSVADVLDGQVDRGLQCLVGVADPVVGFVFRLQTMQYLDGFADGRLDDVDLLEPARKGAILFENAAVFMERGRTDTAQLARRQRWLDQVGRIHRAATGRAGADDRVDFVDEQHRARNLLHRGQHGFQALLEITAILGAGDQCAQIQRVDDRVGEHLGDLAIDDPLGQTFGQRGLADASLADVERIVLAAPAQDLDRALDFVGAADQRIDLARHGQLIEVIGKFCQRVALAFGLTVLGTGAFFVSLGLVAALLGDAMRHVIDDIQSGDVLLVQVIDRM